MKGVRVRQWFELEPFDSIERTVNVVRETLVLNLSRVTALALTKILRLQIM